MPSRSYYINRIIYWAKLVEHDMTVARQLKRNGRTEDVQSYVRTARAANRRLIAWVNHLKAYC